MRALFVLGVGLAGAGLAGYAAGVAVAYPGRAFSLTAVMVGITLALVARGHPEASP